MYFIKSKKKFKIRGIVSKIVNDIFCLENLIFYVFFMGKKWVIIFFLLILN